MAKDFFPTLECSIAGVAVAWHSFRFTACHSSSNRIAAIEVQQRKAGGHVGGKPEERGSFYDASLAFRDNATCFIPLPSWEISGVVGRHARKKVVKFGDVRMLRIMFGCPSIHLLLLPLALVALFICPDKQDGEAKEHDKTSPLSNSDAAAIDLLFLHSLYSWRLFRFIIAFSKNSYPGTKNQMG